MFIFNVDGDVAITAHDNPPFNDFGSGTPSFIVHLTVDGDD